MCACFLADIILEFDFSPAVEHAPRLPSRRVFIYNARGHDMPARVWNARQGTIYAFLPNKKRNMVLRVCDRDGYIRAVAQFLGDQHEGQ